MNIDTELAPGRLVKINGRRYEVTGRRVAMIARNLVPVLELRAVANGRSAYVSNLGTLVSSFGDYRGNRRVKSFTVLE